MFSHYVTCIRTFKYSKEIIQSSTVELRLTSFPKAVIAYESLWNKNSFPLFQDIKAFYFAQILKAFFLFLHCFCFITL